ncbi:outer membrane protein Iml2/Tetratricopeptide repeat protein 39 [Pisolithus marmoratus]|nr:outer membrane protein Iml2/Tetratricopeptide repeat protein 39 [Pisolithus marmoratus]
MASAQDIEGILRLAGQGFDLLFANDLEAAVDVFAAEGQEENSPIYLMGLGVCAFLKAAFGMEPELMEDAMKCLTLAEQGTRKHMKLLKSSPSSHRFPSGIEWEVLHTDTTVLLGLTHALSDSYKGYLQCLYDLNRRVPSASVLSFSTHRPGFSSSAHSKFNKLFKTLYPNGLDGYATPSQSTPAASRRPSEGSIRYAKTTPAIPVRASAFFARWTGLGTLTTTIPVLGTITNPASGPVEELILSGTAFGYGLFNLVLSLLPAKIRNVVGFLGYSHDRQLALKALAVSAARTDVHAVFAGLVLMTYYGVLLLASGYQADEKHIMDQYKGIVRRVSQRYPKGALWILNKAKIQRMTGDPEGAIVTLQEGLQDDRQKSFPEADALLAFELAWTLFQCRRYEESAQVFMGVTKINSRSHATYYFLAAGCYVSAGQSDKAQRLLDTLSEIMRKRRRNMSTEAFIKRKLAFYKKKHARRGGDPKRFTESMKISPAKELAIAWNTHAHVDKETALAHIEELTALTPPVDIQTDTCQPGKLLDLDTPDELAVRSLILGILHRSLGDFAGARKLLHDALKHYQNADPNSWVGGVIHFELAVLDMKEGDWRSVAVSEGNPAEGNTALEVWTHAIKNAKDTLAHAHALCTRETDLSSRLDSRIVMLHEEIDMKMKQLGI